MGHKERLRVAGWCLWALVTALSLAALWIAPITAHFTLAGHVAVTGGIVAIAGGLGLMIYE